MPKKITRRDVDGFLDGLQAELRKMMERGADHRAHCALLDHRIDRFRHELGVLKDPRWSQ